MYSPNIVFLSISSLTEIFGVYIKLFPFVRYCSKYIASLHFRLPPKSDGQTKHINQTLKQSLYMYCNYQ